MFDLEAYKETLEDRRCTLGEYYDSDIGHYAIACDAEAKKAHCAFTTWRKEHSDKIKGFLGNDDWFNAKIDVEAYLEDRYYAFGWYCCIHKVPFDDIILFPYEALKKEEKFVTLLNAYEAQVNALLFDSEEEKALFETYRKLERFYETSLFLALARLGYCHCQTDREAMSGMEGLFQRTVRSVKTKAD